MAQLWFWLLVGYEHNVLEQGLMEIYGFGVVALLVILWSHLLEY